MISSGTLSPHLLWRIRDPTQDLLEKEHVHFPLIIFNQELFPLFKKAARASQRQIVVPKVSSSSSSSSSCSRCPCSRKVLRTACSSTRAVATPSLTRQNRNRVLFPEQQIQGHAERRENNWRETLFKQH